MIKSSKYKPEYCDMLIKEMASGISYLAFAGLIRVSNKTLYNWEKDHPEFAEAKEIAFNACLYFWETKGIAGLTAPKEFNAVVWYMNMKNRFGWRDTPPDEKPPEVHKAEVIRLPIEEMKKLVEAAKAK